jgi:hypothetical protein
MDFQSPGGVGTEQNAWRANIQEQEAQGPGPNNTSILAKDLGGKTPGVGTGHGEHYLVVSPGGAVPISGLAPWGSPSPLEAWMI